MIKFHPVQTEPKTLEKLAEIFRESMERHGVLPKNPWKAKRLEAWLSKMGARFWPGSHHIRWSEVDCSKYVNFKVYCPMLEPRNGGRLAPKINGYREERYVHIEIPWELADKVLVLGHLP